MWNRIFIVATDHDGMYQEECLALFDKLPYKNKIMLVSKDYPQYSFNPYKAVQRKTSVPCYDGVCGYA